MFKIKQVACLIFHMDEVTMIAGGKFCLKLVNKLRSSVLLMQALKTFSNVSFIFSLILLVKCKADRGGVCVLKKLRIW
jgi:hypothetical protein